MRVQEGAEGPRYFSPSRPSCTMQCSQVANDRQNRAIPAGRLVFRGSDHPPVGQKMPVWRWAVLLAGADPTAAGASDVQAGATVRGSMRMVWVSVMEGGR